MKTGKYSLRELLTHNEIDQLVIPELQRDYVWSTNEVEKVWNSFFSKFSGKATASLNIFESGQPVANRSLVSYLEKTYSVLVSKTKMGFVYAYHDKEMPGKFFLIDGQQRLTTFYLVLLAIHVKANEVERFRKQYYENQLPKIDYKVRESAYEFLRLFLDETLAGREFRKSSNFFYNDYKNDKTVNCIIKNYDFILRKLEGLNSEVNLLDLLDYVENYIEFNYFDTRLSEQGESLYLYMNSRGFHLSHQEKIRANLIEKCSVDKKNLAAELWEEWQDFFFKHKYGNENADIGFENFLYYSSLLKKQLLGELSVSTLEKDDQLKDFQIQHLDIEFLKQTLTALKSVLFWENSKEVYISDFFLKVRDQKGNSLKYLFRYLATWYFQLKFSANNVDLTHFRLFILNQSHTRQVADRPSESIINIFTFIDRLQSSSLMNQEIAPNSFFNDSELEKIRLADTNSDFLILVHEIYFDYKLQELLEGRTDILFKLVDAERIQVSDIEEVRKRIEVLRRLFFKNDKEDIQLNLSGKLLRKFILSHFDYTVPLGYIGKYGKRYNLISDNRTWLSRVLNEPAFKSVTDDCLSEPQKTLKELFQKRRNDFTDEYDWRYYFIHYRNVLEHCNRNHFIRHDIISDIILISKEYQSYQDCFLPIKILENFRVHEIPFRQHMLETVFLDLMIVDEVVVTAPEGKPRLTFDVIYQKRGKWSLQIFYKDLPDDSKLDLLSLDGFEKQQSGRWLKQGFFQHLEHTSLKGNLMSLTNNVEVLVGELNKKGCIPLTIN